MDETLRGFANEIFVILVGGLVTYLAALARTYVKKAVERMDGVLDEEARKRLAQSFENAIAAAEARGQTANLDEVIAYVERFNGGDLKRFGLSGHALRARAKAAVAKSAPPTHPEGM